jgi:hypothetical protein
VKSGRRAAPDLVVLPGARQGVRRGEACPTTARPSGALSNLALPDQDVLDRVGGAIDV